MVVPQALLHRVRRMLRPSNALWFWDETVQPVTAFNLALEAWWMAAVSAECGV